MEFEFLKESLKSYIEIRKTLWTALFGLIGGVSALFITLNSTPKGILIVIAIIFVFIDIIAIQEANREINDLLQKIKEIKT